MKFETYTDFYAFYLSEHQDVNCRRLHFVGTFLVICWILTALFSRNAWYLVGGLFTGYFFAWVGHFFFEKNKPATFKYPLRSFISDWVMFADILKGKVSLKK